MWVELRSVKTIERNGKPHQYKPGTRVDVGKQAAMAWVAAGEAILLDTITGSLPGDSGFIVTAGLAQVLAIVRQTDQVTPVLEGPARLEFSRTLIWDASAQLRPDLIPVGFNMLARWQCAMPLWSYTELACSIGTDEDRERTQAVIRDLRVPVYDTRLLFMRRCSDTRALLALWLKERGPDRDDRLAFMRALYAVKPTICPLPDTWAGRKGA